MPGRPNEMVYVEQSGQRDGTSRVYPAMVAMCLGFALLLGVAVLTSTTPATTLGTAAATTALSSTASCPSSCGGCQVGSASNGGRALLNGVCTATCSPGNWCGSGGNYQYGAATNCAGCCPAKCRQCKAGSYSNGGHMLVGGTCLSICAPSGYCGSGSQYKYSQYTDCSSCVADLREAAQKKGIYIGTAINSQHLADSQYTSTAIANFNLATAENACKWGSIARVQGKYNFAACDTIFDFALNKMKGVIRGHNLCWGNYNPSWVAKLSAAQKKSSLVAYIQAVLKHYGKKAIVWDVVNEAISDGGSGASMFKNTVWYPAIQNYVDLAFQTARSAAAPGVKLFYNDYSIWNLGAKSDRVYSMVKSMKQRKIPIDGIGFQMHLNGDSSFSTDSLKANFQRFGALGLDVHITELDISYSTWGPTQEAAQAELYAGILKVCLEVEACRSFETWGFTDKYTWKGSSSHPLPFDINYSPKAAAASIAAQLRA